MLIDGLVSNAGSIAITGHIRPDGDCVGSTMALYTYLKRNYPEKRTDVFLEPPTEKLSFIVNFDKINTAYDTDAEYDLMFCLDCASLERIGKAIRYFETAGKTVNIDHHISNTEFAGGNYVFGNSSSTCEVLYNYLDTQKIDRDIAIALYTGIVYDTGVFKYPSTSPDTMRVVADLMEFDIPANFIIDESFYAKTYNENRIFGHAIINSKLAFDGRVIYSCITRKDLADYGVESRELEGIVSQLRLTRGVWCAVFMHETDDHEFKISFRSGEELDVNKIAAHFGGGGHARASGANISGDQEECMQRILDVIEAEIKEQIPVETVQH